MGGILIFLFETNKSNSLRSCPNGHVYKDKNLVYCPACGLPLGDPEDKAQSSTSYVINQRSTQENTNNAIPPVYVFQRNPNEPPLKKQPSSKEGKKLMKRTLLIILLLVMLYIIAVGITCGIGIITRNLNLLKTGLDLSIAGKIIFPEQYQLVADRAEMEKADSKGVIVYYKNKTGDVILYRERLILSPGYHKINPPEFLGHRKFHLKSSDKTFVDENGHADPNIFHFYYDDPTTDIDSFVDKRK